MTHSLSTPDLDLARRVLTPVPYAARFSVGRLRPPVGVMPGTVRSLHELHLLLTPDDRSLPGVNLTALPGWIADVVGDPELAEAVRLAVGQAGSYVEGCVQTFALVGARLEQARTTTGVRP